MFELLISIYFSYRNAQLAKRKGQNTVLWVVLTIIAFFFFYMVGVGVLTLIIYDGPKEPTAIMEFLMSRPLLVVTFLFIATGGYLLVRYILERMPDVKEDEEE